MSGDVPAPVASTIRIGITGPIGCGKSTVARWLGERPGIEVIDADVIARAVLAPGSPEQILLGARPATPETIAAIREQYHLNDSFFGQYWEWARRAARFDFGRSIRTNEPVAGAIGERFKLTLQLGGLAFPEADAQLIEMLAR